LKYLVALTCAPCGAEACADGRANPCAAAGIAGDRATNGAAGGTARGATQGPARANRRTGPVASIG
jgi:hypothetical protein